MPYLTSATAMMKPPVSPAVEVLASDSRHGEYGIAPLGSQVLRMTISGFWSAPVMTDFARDCVVAVKALPCLAKDHLILCDISGAAIQSQPMFAGFMALLVESRVRPRRVAFVSTNPVSRMQARRLMAARDDVGLFDDEAPALRWLMADA